MDKEVSEETLKKFSEYVGYPQSHLPEFKEALYNKWVQSKNKIFATSSLNNTLEQVIAVLEEIDENSIDFNTASTNTDSKVTNGVASEFDETSNTDEN